jgi:uroporphyrinogen III methyltransferase / synthase
LLALLAKSILRSGNLNDSYGKKRIIYNMKQSDKKTSSKDDNRQAVAQAMSLSGKAILLTRPRQQSEEMTLLLEGLGAKVLHAPMIEIKEPDSWLALDESIHQLDLYDWVIFTSVNGVKFFFHRLAQKSLESMAKISRAKVCAIGLATAKALEKQEVKVDLVAAEAHAEGLLQALLFYTGNLQTLRGKRFLLPRARIARELLPVELSRLGAQVDVVEAYQNVMPEIADDSFLQWLKDGVIDVVTFTSSSTVHNFVTLVGRENLRSLLQHSRIACIGPVTSGTAQEYELQPIIQPQNATAAALVEAIVQAIGSE